MRSSLVVIPLALLACGKKDDGDNAATKQPGPPAGSAAPVAPDKPSAPVPDKPTAPGAPDKVMSCGKLVPKAIVDKYLAGYEATAQTPFPETANCDFKKKTPMATVHVGFVCKDSLKDNMQVMLDATGGTKTPGIGAGATVRDLVSGVRLVVFFGDTTNCKVMISAVGDTDLVKDPVPFAKDLAAALTPASLQ
jgi:hypothetical protein